MKAWIITQGLQVDLGNRMGLFLRTSRVAVWFYFLLASLLHDLTSKWPFQLLCLIYCSFPRATTLGCKCYHVFREKEKKRECSGVLVTNCCLIRFLYCACVNSLHVACALLSNVKGREGHMKKVLFPHKWSRPPPTCSDCSFSAKHQLSPVFTRISQSFVIKITGIS